jgi:hypothetical protein
MIIVNSFGKFSFWKQGSIRHIMLYIIIAYPWLWNYSRQNLQDPLRAKNEEISEDASCVFLCCLNLTSSSSSSCSCQWGRTISLIVATTWPIAHPPNYVWLWSPGGMILIGELKNFQKKPILMPLCPPQIPHGLTWSVNRPPWWEANH